MDIKEKREIESDEFFNHFKNSLQNVVDGDVKIRKVELNKYFKIRNDLNLSREEFANILGTNIETVENWERNKSKPSKANEKMISWLSIYPELLQKLKNKVE